MGQDGDNVMAWPLGLCVQPELGQGRVWRHGGPVLFRMVTFTSFQNSNNSWVLRFEPYLSMRWIWVMVLHLLGLVVGQLIKWEYLGGDKKLPEIVL